MSLNEHYIRMWLHALALLSVVLVFGVSFALLSEVIGINSPSLELLLMFYFLGIAKVAEPLFTLRMPRVLFQLRHWEQDSDVLRRLRVFSFGRIVRRTPLRDLNSRLYLDQQRRDPSMVRCKAEAAEAIHFWAAVLFMPCIALAAITGKWGVFALFSMAQVLVNIYPILHLRHTRGRLDRSIQRAKRKP